MCVTFMGYFSGEIAHNVLRTMFCLLCCPVILMFKELKFSFILRELLILHYTPAIPQQRILLILCALRVINFVAVI